jgi:NAD+ diphosphatase
VTSHPDFGPKPRLGYTQSRIERVAERRPDAAWLARAQDHAQAATYVLGGELIVLKKTPGLHGAAFSLAEARAFGDSTEIVFLGLLEGAPRFGYGLDPAIAAALKLRDDLVVIDLRSIAVQGLVSADHLPPLAEAKALLHWHVRHRFCSHCGAATQLTQGGWRRDCPSCASTHFPRTDPVVIMLASDGDNCVLGRSGRFANTMWSCLAGFVEPGESFEDAVRREVCEEVGIACGRVNYFASQPWPFPTTLMIGCHAEALSRNIVVDREELEDARWFSRDEAVAMLARRHPAGLTTPPPIAIAYHLIRAWVEKESGVF